MSESDFNEFVLEISRHIPSSKTSELKFLADIPYGTGEKIKTYFDFIIWAKQNGEISTTDLSYLAEMTKKIRYNNIASKIEKYQKYVNESSSKQVPTAKLVESVQQVGPVQPVLIENLFDAMANMSIGEYGKHHSEIQKTLEKYTDHIRSYLPVKIVASLWNLNLDDNSDYETFMNTNAMKNVILLALGNVGLDQYRIEKPNSSNFENCYDQLILDTSFEHLVGLKMNEFINLMSEARMFWKLAKLVPSNKCTEQVLAKSRHLLGNWIYEYPYNKKQVIDLLQHESTITGLTLVLSKQSWMKIYEDTLYSDIVMVPEETTTGQTWPTKDLKNIKGVDQSIIDILVKYLEQEGYDSTSIGEFDMDDFKEDPLSKLSLGMGQKKSIRRILKNCVV